MTGFAVRAAGAWSALPFGLKAAVMVALLVALSLLAVSPILAIEPEPNPFRWRA